MGLGKKPFEKEKKEKLLVQAISPFPTMFSTLSKTEIIIFVTFNLSSANAFNLVWSKILSSGNGLTLCNNEILHPFILTTAADNILNISAGISVAFGKKENNI